MTLQAGIEACAGREEPPTALARRAPSVTVRTAAGLSISVDIATPRGRGGALPAWLPPLPLASAIVATSLLLGWSLAAYAAALASVGARGTDFAQYYVAARLTLAHGWAAPYDVADFMTAVHQLTGQRDAYANTPVPTAMVMPLTRLPLGAAYALWNAVAVAAFAAACWIVAPGRGWERAAQLLASLAAFQVLSAIGLGQLVLVVGPILVLHWWLLRRDRPVLAGIVLGLGFVKPQDVVLVPVVLLLTGRWRAALAAAATAAALGGACLLALGEHGLHLYLQTVTFETQHMYAGRFTLMSVLSGALPAALVIAVPAALCVAAALRTAGTAPDRPLVAAVLASQLATPYLNGADLALLVPCAWLTVRSGGPRWLGWIGVAVNFLPAQQDSSFRTAAVGVELLWLAALALPAAAGWWRGRAAAVTV